MLNFSIHVSDPFAVEMFFCAHFGSTYTENEMFPPPPFF